MSTKVDELNPNEALVLVCQDVLGTGSGYDMNHVLRCFDAKLWAAEENEELTPELKDELIRSKNILLRNLVIKQVNEVGHFTIDKSPPFENTCTHCNGVGERYKFVRKSKRVKCMKCQNGKIIETCPTCKGTGRFVTKDDEENVPLTINVVCKTCEGKKIEEGSEKTQIEYVCRICHGRTTVKTFAIIGVLRSTTPCEQCKGLGFLPPKKKRVPDNPVLDENLGNKIKEELVKDTQIPVSLGHLETGTYSTEDKVALDEGTFQAKQAPASE